MSEQHPTPQQTLALFLGAGSFPRARTLQQGPAFYNSARGLQEYLMNPYGLGLPADNVHWLFDDSRSPSDQLQNIGDFLARRASVLASQGVEPMALIVYYVGHLLFLEPDPTTYLAIKYTREDNEGITSLRVHDLASVIETEARLLRKFFILDSCVSTAAYSGFQSALFTGNRLNIFPEFRERAPIILWSACREHSPQPSGLSRTRFTDALLSVLNQGDASLGSLLSIGEVAELVKVKLREAYPDTLEPPEVQSLDQREGDVANVPLFPNLALFQPRAQQERDRVAPVEQAKTLDAGSAERLKEEIEKMERALGVTEEQMKVGPQEHAGALQKALESKLAQSEPGSHLYTVWYGTNRKPTNSSVPQSGFTNDRDSDGTVHYGFATVAIPKSHTFGSVGTPWWKRWAKMKFQDDHLKILSLHETENADEFFSHVRHELEELERSDRQIMLYLHGYCVSFDEAAVRAAQIGFDLKVGGITAFFSWPSSACFEGYFADADRIAASEPAITSFLIRLTQDTGAKTVHLIAHSMGNRGLARSIQRITGDASRTGIRFGQIILAAPDIEVSLFRDLAAIYPRISERTTMYVSAKDRALGLSKWLQDSDRAGFTPPITVVPEIDTIEVTNIDLTLLGHSYYAEAEAVLYDMSDLLAHNTPPGRRPRTRPASKGVDSKYWVIGR